MVEKTSEQSQPGEPKNWYLGQKPEPYEVRNARMKYIWASHLLTEKQQKLDHWKQKLATIDSDQKKAKLQAKIDQAQESMHSCKQSQTLNGRKSGLIKEGSSED